MQFRIGFELTYSCTQPTPMIAILGVHHSRVSDLIRPDYLVTRPALPLRGYRDGFGNWCNRLLLPAGRTTFSTDALIEDSGLPDPVDFDAQQHLVQDLPEEALGYLLGSRYCETDRFYDIAWRQFGQVPSGWARVQAISDFVHRHIAFGYEHANPTKTAWDAYQQGRGVCRDYAHLAITLCRCLNMPARYCTGYLGDVGTPQPWGAGDFAGWFEVYLGGQWHTFDPRNNARRIGRVLIARGRDAADVAITTSFGLATLESFRVWMDESQPEALAA
ncbi:MAG: transglutaminase family protein [Stagnimonas sp.]|nr:transglutaminase family protein [Stagnimonas sp.]